MEKILTIMGYRRKSWRLRWIWGEEGLRGKVIRKGKRKDLQELIRVLMGCCELNSIFLKCCKHIANMTYIKFNDKFYKQKIWPPHRKSTQQNISLSINRIFRIWSLQIRITKQHHIFQIYLWYTYIPTPKHQNWRDRRKTKQCWTLHQLHLWKKI